MKDLRGTPVTVGADVAYNLSGYVARGVIISARHISTNQWGHIKADIRVRLAHSACGHERGHISKVRDPKSVLVLLADDA